MVIVTRQLDVFKSKIFRDKIINHYIIYLMIGEIAIKAGIAFGEEEKNNIEKEFLFEING
jgi:hypothetical protein